MLFERSKITVDYTDTTSAIKVVLPIMTTASLAHSSNQCTNALCPINGALGSGVLRVLGATALGNKQIEVDV